MKLYGYTGGSQRICAIVDGKKKVLAWGDKITPEELRPAIDAYEKAWIEDVTDPIAEQAAYPPYWVGDKG